MRFKDRVAVITGSGQGIGRAYALEFARQGAKVVVVDLNEENAKAVAAEIQAEGFPALAVGTDIAEGASVSAMVARTVEEFGGIDILVNNAAIFATLKMKPFEEITLGEWNLVQSVNSTGTFLCCQAVAPIMRAAGYGRIVNVSSSVVMTGRANYAHYVASKGAVWALTHALATELGTDGITVNAVSPHGIVTEVPRETITEDQWDSILADQALKRRGEVSDMVGAVLFLASDDSKYMTGQTLGLDAGLRYT
ncbi:SDR family NAD(P)-dependent oxidoreductase [Leucobacter soli]|uniref:(S)-1-Phenylethanol dehydrogenase n=1 Tax=Leucobacter soli TaxID=2812850 RepID=A0A916NIU7_9MICO|nr:3-oxoacyl-ACP reductase family protein [Leucobacter soli]CAG7619364.1 (S)-1-Phenylethanol dehydrogenase [Leucobacter soli]